MSLDFNKKIYGYDDLFNFFIKLDRNERIPNKFILLEIKELVNLLLHII